MCGRIAQIKSPKVAAVNLDLKVDLEIIPKYNLGPSSLIWTVVEGVMQQVTWGFKNEQSSTLIINARNESVLEKPTFKDLWETQRCVIPADGYYEWEHTSAGQKPNYITLKNNEVMFFAGLFRMEADGLKVSLITRAANEYLSKIHNRMPLMIRPQYIKAYLDDSAPKSEEIYLTESDAFKSHQVSSLVNTMKVDNEDLIRPIPPQLKLF